jgi:hypothetical protein
MSHEFAIVPYITLTRENAKNIIWPALISVTKRLGVEVEMKKNSGDVVFPHNGSKIILRGCDSSGEIEKLRGPKYPGAVIDEAQSFPEYMMTLIDEVLEPATMDYGGQIMVTGTPGPLPVGPFYRITNGIEPGWSVHHWTWRDNPHLPNRFEWIQEKIARHNWDENTPKYQREYEGKWVHDSDSLVYLFSDTRNVAPMFRPSIWNDTAYVLGIDLGFNDPSAFCVLAYSYETGERVVVESFQKSGMLAVDVAAAINDLSERYDFDKIVCDSGGFGKSIVESLRREYGIPAHAAEKSEKATAISNLNGELVNGKLKIVRSMNEELITQLQLLQWSERSLAAGVPKEDRRTQNHLCDAMLYANRSCGWSLEGPAPEGPEKGSDEWWAAEEKRMWEEIEEQERRKHINSFDLPW